MNISFKGKTVVITGGTRGIGKSIAEKVHHCGGAVIVTGTKSNKPSSVKKEIKYEKLDLTSETSICRFVEVLNRYSQIDVLINNAGTNIIQNIDQIKQSDFLNVLNTNLVGPFTLSKEISKLMRSNCGKIINIGSIWSVISKKGRINYITSKSGLAGLTRGLATDLAHKNILVNTLSPGFVDTDLTRKSLSDTDIAGLVADIPLNRLCQPDEIANVVAFLASDLNTYITGQNILVDGGFSNV